MLSLTSDLTIWLCTQPTDMRKSFNGLSAQVRKLMLESPSDGALFVFINRRQTQMTCLYFESGGYCVRAKRLEQGQFSLPRHATTIKHPLSATQFLSLIEGFDILIKRQRNSAETVDLKTRCPPINTSLLAHMGNPATTII